MAKEKFIRKSAFEEEAKKIETLNKNIEEKIKRNEIFEINISDIVNPKKHDRVGYSKEAISEFSISLKKVGQLQPIVVRELNDGKLERLIGFRRILAAKELGWTTIKTIILKDVQDDIASLIMLTENMHREDPNLYDQTLKIIEYVSLSLNISENELKKLLFKLRNFDSGQLRQLTEDEKDEREKIEIALEKTVKISITTLVDRLRIFNLNDKLVDAMRKDNLSYANAMELNKIKNESYFNSILEKTIINKLSKNELKLLIKTHKESELPTKTNEEHKLLDKIKSINLKKIKKLDESSRKIVLAKLKEIDLIIENL